MDETLYTKALRYLSRRPRSEKEVRDYLTRKLSVILSREKNLPRKEAPSPTVQDDIDLVIQKLTQQKFLNDEEFAVWWIDQRTRIKPKGWRVIAMELQQKGISKDIVKIQELRFKNQEGEEKRDEKELAMELVKKRLRKYQDMPKDELFRKLGGFLARRGFTMDVITSCIDEVLGKSV